MHSTGGGGVGKYSFLFWGLDLISLHHVSPTVWALLYMIKGKYLVIRCFAKLYYEHTESGYIAIVYGISSPNYYIVLFSLCLF